jgi:hypothetical protein
MAEQEYDNLSDNIKEIVDNWDDYKYAFTEIKKRQSRLKKLGWTCSYGLWCELYGVEELINNNH